MINLSELLNVIISSIISFSALFFLTKIQGNKQVSQLTFFDYVNGITIGSIAAEVATTLEGNSIKPLVAMIIYGMIVLIISVISSKSLVLRRFFTGRAVVLYDNGTLYYKNFARTKLDLTEFLTQLRISGYFDLDDVQTVISETSGNLSVLPKSSAQPPTAKDLKMPVSQKKCNTVVVADGKILNKNLESTGKDRKWLFDELTKKNLNRIEDIFLAVIDETNTLKVYDKTMEKTKNDIFE